MKEIIKKDLATSYILVAGKDEKDLKNLLDDLKGYMIEKTDNSEIDIKHKFEGYKTYISVKNEFTTILNDYWKENKIHVECVGSRDNIISDFSKKLTDEKLKRKGCTKWGFIIDENYEERKLMSKAN